MATWCDFSGAQLCAWLCTPQETRVFSCSSWGSFQKPDFPIPASSGHQKPSFAHRMSKGETEHWAWDQTFQHLEQVGSCHWEGSKQYRPYLGSGKEKVDPGERHALPERRAGPGLAEGSRPALCRGWEQSKRLRVSRYLTREHWRTAQNTCGVCALLNRKFISEPPRKHKDFAYLDESSGSLVWLRL